MEVAPFFVDFHHFLSIFTIFCWFSRFTHFCRDLHFAEIYALFPQIFFGQNSHLRYITRFSHVWVGWMEICVGWFYEHHFVVLIRQNYFVRLGKNQQWIALWPLTMTTFMMHRMLGILDWWHCLLNADQTGLQKCSPRQDLSYVLAK